MSVTRDTFRARYEAARAWGPFNYELHFRLIRGEAIVGAARGERVEFDRSGACVRTPLDDAERRRFLIEDLGIHEAIVQRLPADTRIGPWRRSGFSPLRLLRCRAPLIVYKARERIHRSVADLRLLATPTSWSRVADSNPNQARFFGIRSPSRDRSPL